jgi:ParB-like chromosome segregation protein Spo0J
MEHLKIEYLPIDDLKPYDRNAKEHPQEQIDQIIESIRQFGMNDPIGIWSDENLIVEGHGRLLALQQMGETMAPTIRLDHMTDEQRRAYTLVHNKTTMNSGFDMEMLHAELEELDIDMEEFGFTSIDPVDIDQFFEDAEPKEKEPKKIQCPHCGEWFEQ